MIAAANILDQTRGMAAALVDRAERETGSRMSAYERVAASVGVSASWIRKFISGDAKCPNFIAGLNIISQYGNLCARIEASANKEKARADELWGNVDAASASALEMVARMAETKTSGDGPPSDAKGQGE